MEVTTEVLLPNWALLTKLSSATTVEERPFRAA
jgi:hypothetical protein